MWEDRISKYLAAHADELDQVEQPDLNRLWNDFNRAKPAKVVKRRFWMIAAAVVLLVSVSSGLVGYYLAGTSPDSLAEIFADDAHVSDHYLNLVSEIEVRERQLAQKDIKKEDYQVLFEAIEELNGIQEIYKSDLTSHLNEPALIKSLLRQYEKKARLLELLLFEIEKESKNEERDSFTRL